jgi:hypothetical protein
VPPSEVSVCRGEPVGAADGDIGRVQGVVIDRASYQVTHVLLREERLRGRRNVAIPISAAAGIEDNGVRLRITRREVQDLPLVALVTAAGNPGELGAMTRFPLRAPGRRPCFFRGKRSVE